MKHFSPAPINDDLAKTLTGLISEPPLELRRRLLATMALYGNEDAVSRDYAIDAICEGRPAYWRTTGYSDTGTSSMVDALNSGAPFVDAWNGAFRPHQRAFWAKALDYIVPINRAAAVTLAAAYETLGTWRDDAELELRRTRRAYGDRRFQDARERLS